MSLLLISIAIGLQVSKNGCRLKDGKGDETVGVGKLEKVGSNGVVGLAGSDALGCSYASYGFIQASLASSGCNNAFNIDASLSLRHMNVEGSEWYTSLEDAHLSVGSVVRSDVTGKLAKYTVGNGDCNTQVSQPTLFTLRLTELTIYSTGGFSSSRMPISSTI